MAKKDKKTTETALELYEGAESDKMTIYDYEHKYTRRQNVRGVRFLLHFVAITIGVLIFAALADISYEVYEIQPYAGYGVAALCLILYICFFIVPLVKIFKTGYFKVNVNAFTAREAQRHNKQLRHDIADKIIDLTASVDGVGWYDSEVVGKLAIAVKVHDEEGIKSNLTDLYSGSIKKSAKSLIFRSSMKSAMYSAISQTNNIDALLVAVVNLQLIKDIVFLYGFRPSDAKLLRIFIAVMRNSLAAYGLGNVKIGNTIVKTMGDAVKGIPILGSAISALVDSSIQGLTNGVLTAVIGYQTIKYLNDEYKLQNMLDGITVAETEEELEETCAELEKELKGNRNKMPQAV